MHILFLTDNFPPENNAPASRTYEHTRHWIKQGHQVTVITGVPNFPTGQVFPGYRNAWYSTETMEGVRVVRVKTYITANQGFLKRILDYQSFMVSGFLAGLIQNRPDVIVGTSPQFFTNCAAWLLSICRRRPFIFELRDLWPASIVTVGAMRENVSIRALEKLELFLYRQAAAVVPVTYAFKDDLTRRGIPSGKIGVVRNGVDLSQYMPRARDPELTALYGLENKFVVGYLGTHGLAHALHSVLETADQLRDYPDIVFLLIGEGAKRQELIQQADILGLSNVRLIPSQPKEMMPRLWSLCNLSLIHLKNDPVFATVIPSKLFESMGMGLPVLMALPEGEATSIIHETGAGVVVRPEDPKALAQIVKELFNDPERLMALSAASLAAATKFTREKQADRLLAIIEAVAVGDGMTIGKTISAI
ncbi:MAG: glycosyltransferase family 4 protein [Candidatus Competibacteraceae bacterium]|nr:glycosyltransferase family 4 protein [Candidatus Competibacteraceae bacterium]